LALGADARRSCDVEMSSEGPAKPEARKKTRMLSDLRVDTLSIECPPRGRYNIAKLVEKSGDAKRKA
jgi:hypothetical protein